VQRIFIQPQVSAFHHRLSQLIGDRQRGSRMTFAD
jgi:hypothetical protein